MRASVTLSGLVLFAACSSDVGLVDLNDKPSEVEDPVVDTEIVDSDTDAAPVDTDVPDPTTNEGIPVAQKPVYANTSDTLFEVDPATGLATFIGTFTVAGAPLEGIVDIAIDPWGRLYGGDRGEQNEGPYTLYRIDPTNATATVVCTTDIQMTALTFTSTGLLVAGGADTLTAIDIGAACADSTLFRGDWETSGDLVGLPDGLLYWTVRGEDSDELVVVDPRTGLAAARGEIGFERLYGVGYDEAAGRLYGFSAGGEIVEITPSSGEARLLSENEELGWWGATTNPVTWSTPVATPAP